MTFSLDSFHPDRLACDHCGHHVGPVALDDGDDPATLHSLTEDQVAHRWSELAEAVRLHSLLCTRGGGGDAGGVGALNGAKAGQFHPTARMHSGPS